MYVKCSCIGKLNMLTTFKEDLCLDEDIESNIKNNDLHIKDKGKVVFIVAAENNYLKFFPSPDLNPIKQLSILQCIFDSFMYHYSNLNEDLIELEEEGIHIMPLISEVHQ